MQQENIKNCNKLQIFVNKSKPSHKFYLNSEILN